MYDNILHKELVMRPGASTAAWSILQALLEKDHTRRLGYRDDFVSYLVLIYHPLVDNFVEYFVSVSIGFLQFSYLSITFKQGVLNWNIKKSLYVISHLLQNEVKGHDFFSSINWDDLEHKKLPPPFNPIVVRLRLTINETFLNIYSPSGYPRYRLVCFFIGTELQKCSITHHQWVLWMRAIRMRVQTADKTSQWSKSDPHDSSPSVNVVWREKLCICKKDIHFKPILVYP